MSLLDRIKAKISPTNQPTKTPEPDSRGITTVDITEEEKESAQKREYQIPIQPGEYFPWKGLLFQVTHSKGLQFTAECKGLTKNRAEKLGLA